MKIEFDTRDLESLKSAKEKLDARADAIFKQTKAARKEKGKDVETVFYAKTKKNNVEILANLVNEYAFCYETSKIVGKYIKQLEKKAERQAPAVEKTVSEEIPFVPESDEKVVTDAPEDAAKVVTDAPENDAKVVTDAPENDAKVVTDAPEDAAKVVTSAPENDAKVVTDAPENDAKVVTDVPENDAKVVTSAPENDAPVLTENKETALVVETPEIRRVRQTNEALIAFNKALIEQRRAAAKVEQAKRDLERLNMAQDPKYSNVHEAAANVHEAKRNAIETEIEMLDGVYRKSSPKEIIQDLPVNSSLNQKYKTSGMTDEEIKASQAKIAAVPEAKATPTKSWIEMKDSINTLMLKKEIDDKNLDPDDIYALYFLRRHPEAAPTPTFLNELLVWAGIAPLEPTTPRKNAPAPVQTDDKFRVAGNPVPIISDTTVVPGSVDDKKVESTDSSHIRPATDEEIEAMRTAVDAARAQGRESDSIIPATDDDIDAVRTDVDSSRTAGGSSDDVTPLTDDEIEAARAEGEGKGVAPENDAPKAKDPLSVTPEERDKFISAVEAEKEAKKSKKGKKVVGIKQWASDKASRFSKKFLVLKAMVFTDGLNKHSNEYKELAIDLANLNGNYKQLSSEDRNQVLSALLAKIKTSSLDAKESRKIYTKYVRLAKKIERYGKKHPEAKTVSSVEPANSTPINSNPSADEDVDPEIAAAVAEVFDEIEADQSRGKDIDPEIVAAAAEVFKGTEANRGRGR